MHGYEIEYVFGVPIYNTTAGYTNRERILSQKMIQFWATFAQTGYVHLIIIVTCYHLQFITLIVCSVPVLRTSKETEEWPRYDPVNNRKWMHLKGGSHIRPIPSSKEKECKVWRTERELSFNNYCKYSYNNSVMHLFFQTYHSYQVHLGLHHFLSQ